MGNNKNKKYYLDLLTVVTENWLHIIGKLWVNPF